MSSFSYMAGRRKWSRPQGMLFSDNSGTILSGSYVPSGSEWDDFIIPSDHNRSALSLSNQRIEVRQRMVNGGMRSYHKTDKLNLSCSWERLPSRAFADDPEFNSFGQLTNDVEIYTADNGAGGVDLLSWYESHPGPFFVFLSYDKFRSQDGFPQDDISQWPTDYNTFSKYKQVLKMYFSSFDYEIEKRGSNNHDLWNINMTLEEA